MNNGIKKTQTDGDLIPNSITTDVRQNEKHASLKPLLILEKPSKLGVLRTKLCHSKVLHQCGDFNLERGESDFKYWLEAQSIQQDQAATEHAEAKWKTHASNNPTRGPEDQDHLKWPPPCSHYQLALKYRKSAKTAAAIPAG